jgi:hypothetical protein
MLQSVRCAPAWCRTTVSCHWSKATNAAQQPRPGRRPQPGISRRDADAENSRMKSGFQLCVPRIPARQIIQSVGCPRPGYMQRDPVYPLIERTRIFNTQGSGHPLSVRPCLPPSIRIMNNEDVTPNPHYALRHWHGDGEQICGVCIKRIIAHPFDTLRVGSPKACS